MLAAMPVNRVAYVKKDRVLKLDRCRFVFFFFFFFFLSTSTKK
jgi:hypothetical protein